MINDIGIDTLFIINLAVTVVWQLKIRSQKPFRLSAQQGPPVSTRSRKFFDLESHGKISNFLIIELFYSCILMKRYSLHTISFRRINLYVIRYRWTKTGFAGPKSFRGFRETGTKIETDPDAFLRTCLLWFTWEFVFEYTVWEKYAIGRGQTGITNMTIKQLQMFFVITENVHMDCTCRCISSLEDEFDKLPNGVKILVAYNSVVHGCCCCCCCYCCCCCCYCCCCRCCCCCCCWGGNIDTTTVSQTFLIQSDCDFQPIER